MRWGLIKPLILVAVAAAFGAPLLAQTTLTQAPAAQNLPRIASNDNRTPAGALNGGVLTLSLDVRKGLVHPESDGGEAIAVYAFAETGKPLQAPGPTIRVPEGTTIDITLHNDLTVPATVHGLHARPGDDKDVINVAAGTTEHVRFIAGTPGTYLYQARTPDGSRGANRVNDALLGGALVVDSAGTTVTATDRIFVLQRWNGATRTMINGKSWPYTERLNAQVGELVHWRIVNASDQNHPMHLHGGDFELDAVGDGEHYQPFAAGVQPVEFTQDVEIGETFDMSWTPTEPGYWLFHCHRAAHVRLPSDLDPADVVAAGDHSHMSDMDSIYDDMGGMVLGITVTGPAKINTAVNWKPERQLKLTVGAQNGDPRFYQLALADLKAPANTKPQLSTGLAGPVIVLNQNQPTEITVVNALKSEMTSIHWHGMELESYYDGVPGWGGLDELRTPHLEAGKSFTVRMIPQQAGTFMYHTHTSQGNELTGGVDGILIVLPAGQKYDPTTDMPFIFSQTGNDPFGAGMLIMNGQPLAPTVQLKTGTTYRFRFVNITPGVNTLRVSLRQNGAPVDWTLVDKDASPRFVGPAVRKADEQVAIGETYDFEYRATAPEQLTLEAVNPGDGRHIVQTLAFANP